MSSVIDLWASTLDLTREELIDIMVRYIEGATERDRYVYRDYFNEEEIGRTDVLSFEEHVPNAPRDGDMSNAFFVRLFGLEDDERAPLPTAYFKITVEPIDRPVERND